MAARARRLRGWAAALRGDQRRQRWAGAGCRGRAGPSPPCPPEPEPPGDYTSPSLPVSVAAAHIWISTAPSPHPTLLKSQKCHRRRHPACNHDAHDLPLWKMKSPISKTANGVMEKADPLCRIWFTCKGNLICAREAGLVTFWGVQSPNSISNSISEMSDQLRSQSLPPKRVVSPNLLYGAREIRIMQRSVSDQTGTEVGAIQTISQSRLSSEDSSFDSWEVSPQSSFSRSRQASPTVTDEAISNSGFSPFCRGNDNEVMSEVLPSIHESDDNALHFEQEEKRLDIDIFVKLKEAYVELDNLRKKAFDESSRRHKAEEELIKCCQKVAGMLTANHI